VVVRLDGKKEGGAMPWGPGQKKGTERSCGVGKLPRSRRERETKIAATVRRFLGVLAKRTFGANLALGGVGGKVSTKDL